MFLLAGCVEQDGSHSRHGIKQILTDKITIIDDILNWTLRGRCENLFVRTARKRHRDVLRRKMGLALYFVFFYVGVRIFFP